MNALHDRCTGLRLVAVGAVALLVLACSDPTGPVHGDIPRARATWLAASIDDYRFEVSTASSWFPRSGYVSVRVVDGEVVSAMDDDGDPVEQFDLTIEELWSHLLKAHADGQLHQARFGRWGVPVEVNLGPWELDGGAAYWIRDFEPER